MPAAAGAQVAAWIDGPGVVDARRDVHLLGAGRSSVRGLGQSLLETVALRRSARAILDHLRDLSGYRVSLRNKSRR